jgi:mannose-6-phosphate isomerase-like protein (cupin superfamily)
MIGFSTDIEHAAEHNDAFRKVLYTGVHSQLVVMTLQPGEEIGLERHDTVDQFIRVESGTALAVLDGERHDLEEDWAIVIPAGVTHNVINTSGEEPLRLYTIYSPPNHPEGTIHETKADAERAELAHLPGSSLPR